MTGRRVSTLSQRKRVSDEVLGGRDPGAPGPLRQTRIDDEGDSVPQEPTEGEIVESEADVPALEGGIGVSPGDVVEERELQAAYTHAEPKGSKCDGCRWWAGRDGLAVAFEKLCTSPKVSDYVGDRTDLGRGPPNGCKFYEA